ncbi:hypothetical protein DFJ74DRAFT_769131 [Hyaloraphidium curvatum]|nr:hypothetical protein DFJ74DRAFT_769131 [Hyaloraphidium curvatum]
MKSPKRLVRDLTLKPLPTMPAPLAARRGCGTVLLCRSRASQAVLPCAAAARRPLALLAAARPGTPSRAPHPPSRPTVPSAFLAPTSRRWKHINVYRAVLKLTKKAEYAIRGLAKKYKQHYYYIDDVCRFAGWIGKFHPDEAWRTEWLERYQKWEDYRTDNFDKSVLWQDDEMDLKLARMLYNREELLAKQLEAVQKDLDAFMELVMQLPERRPLWFPRYPRIVELGKDAKMTKGKKRQRRWEEKALQDAMENGTLWQPAPTFRNTSNHPWSPENRAKAGGENGEPATDSGPRPAEDRPPPRRNPMNALQRGSLLPKQSNVVKKKAPPPATYVPKVSGGPFIGKEGVRKLVSRRAEPAVAKKGGRSAKRAAKASGAAKPVKPVKVQPRTTARAILEAKAKAKRRTIATRRQRKQTRKND